MNQANRALFELHLARAYEDLFASDPRYAPAAARHTPSELAYKVTLGLAQGGTDKNGEGVKRACKLLKIKHTYKAIDAYLNAPGANPGIEVKETIDGKWMILCNGFQWGEPPLDASGCSFQVWDTKELALAAWQEQLAF